MAKTVKVKVGGKILDSWATTDFNRFFSMLELAKNNTKDRGLTVLDIVIVMGHMFEDRRKLVSDALGLALIEAFSIWCDDKRAHMWKRVLGDYLDISLTPVSWYHSDYRAWLNAIKARCVKDNLIHDNFVILTEAILSETMIDTFPEYNRRTLNPNLQSQIRAAFLLFLEFGDRDFWKSAVLVASYNRLSSDDLNSIKKSIELGRERDGASAFVYVSALPAVPTVTVKPKEVVGVATLDNSHSPAQLSPPLIPVGTTSDIDALIGRIDKFIDVLISTREPGNMFFATPQITLKQTYSGYTFQRYGGHAIQTAALSNKSLSTDELREIVREEIEKIFGSTASKPEDKQVTEYIQPKVEDKSLTVPKVKVEKKEKYNILILGLKQNQQQDLQRGLPSNVVLEAYYDFDTSARKRINQVDFIIITRFGGHTRVETIKSAGLKNYSYVSGGITSVRAKISEYLATVGIDT